MHDLLKHHLVRGVLGTGGLGVINKGLSLLIAILLARGLGAEGYGYYAFGMAVISLTAIPTQHHQWHSTGPCPPGLPMVVWESSQNGL